MALGQHFPILQIVGFQNSGKTTLMEKLINKAAMDGLNVASIKHHGHGGAPDNQQVSKDSIRHQKAGAMVSGVEGNGVLQIAGRRDRWSLEEIIEIYHFFSPDALFIEGYKQENYQKVVLIRDESDFPKLQSLTNIICVISWNDLQDKEKKQHYPFFLLNEEKKYMEFLMRIVRGQDGTKII
jgi:molybdopterin-guanine dinucleotide biosynthesis adapter protein